jgi:hypothetical protein
MGAAILDQDGLSDWLAFGLLKLSKEERRQDGLLDSLVTVVTSKRLLTISYRSFGKRLPLFLSCTYFDQFSSGGHKVQNNFYN